MIVPTTARSPQRFSSAGRMRAEARLERTERAVEAACAAGGVVVVAPTPAPLGRGHGVGNALLLLFKLLALVLGSSSGGCAAALHLPRGSELRIGVGATGGRPLLLEPGAANASARRVVTVGFWDAWWMRVARPRRASAPSSRPRCARATRPPTPAPC